MVGGVFVPTDTEYTLIRLHGCNSLTSLPETLHMNIGYILAVLTFTQLFGYTRANAVKESV